MEGTPNPLQKLVCDADRQGFVISERTIPPERLLASVAWIELTAFALFFLGPFYNDFYQWLKVQIPGLWRTFFDANNPERIQPAAVTARGPVAQNWSLGFSVWAEFRYGRVKLLFPNQCSESIMTDTVTKFAELMYAYARGQTFDDIDLDSEKDCYYGVIVVAYAPDEGKLHVVNPFENLDPQQLSNLRRLEREKRTQARGSHSTRPP